MNEITSILAFRQPSAVEDRCQTFLRNGARQLLAGGRDRVAGVSEDDGRAEAGGWPCPGGAARFGPARKIATGIGATVVGRPKVRDRGATELIEIRFTSGDRAAVGAADQVPDCLLPIDYLRHLDPDFKDAPRRCSARIREAVAIVISGLKPHGRASTSTCRRAMCLRGAMSTSRRTTFSCRPGMNDRSECTLVLIGATPEGKKELIGFEVGVSESTQSWRQRALIHIRRQGPQVGA
ncbi:hypothetical protein ACNJYD_08680 [Bradyrhizobium sp. DASA03005]|uniref:hypothetical protein n=1 Tax=Bradyrhizobium sp. SPXBL-02 TaxID=3395912 RepID=UPI003F718F03